MITIAWDIDDVLNNLTEEWLAIQPTPPPFSSLTSNPPAELLGLSREQYLKSLDHFRATRYDTLRPNTLILEWFSLHGHLARHVALSAVPRTFAPVSAAWVLTHFGDWIRSFSFVPSPRPTDSHPVYDNSKGEFLSHTDKIDVLVEDTEANALAARQLGLTACLYPQPWNSAKDSSVQDLLSHLTDLISKPHPSTDKL
jgi:hypothetical protein